VLKQKWLLAELVFFGPGFGDRRGSFLLAKVFALAIIARAIELRGI
jgi:hypothetical protein